MGIFKRKADLAERLSEKIAKADEAIYAKSLTLYGGYSDDELTAEWEELKAEAVENDPRLRACEAVIAARKSGNQ